MTPEDMAHRSIRFPEKHVFFMFVSLLHFCLRSPWTKALDVIDNSPELTCSLGLQDCKIISESVYEADPGGPVRVSAVDVKAALCCSRAQLCGPCLQVLVSLTEEMDDLEQSGDTSLHKAVEASGLSIYQEELVKICFSSPGFGDLCKRVQFTFSRTNVSTSTYEILLTEKATFGSPILIRVLAPLKEYRRNITVPSLEKVCFLHPERRKIEDCQLPSLQVVTDRKKAIVRLKLEDNENNKTLMCQMLWDETPGEMIPMCESRQEIVISLKSAAPCLCFQVWWKDNQLRRKYCPFRNQQAVMERMVHSVSLALMEFARGGRSVLLWNVSAPCRLKADVWLCKKEVVSGDCQEVTGSRQKLDGRAGWVATMDRVATHREHWKTGVFNISSHPLFCLQIIIDGIQSPLDPYCPFAVSQWRWTALLLVALLLLSTIGACCIQGAIKAFAQRGSKEKDVKRAVGGGHVVLLYPPDDEQALPGLMCHLGSSLQALGCSVSLDLWSHAELSILGPVPWLHSRLDQLQRHGGKVVLVLTQAAWRKAEEWGANTWEKFTTTDSRSSSNCVDVFSASLSCILADYLQGRAGERFMLVQFESLPPEGVCQPLPELFRGLHVYSLPSQSLGFLTELAGARQMATSSSRRKRAHGLRMASRALARGLSAFTAGTAVLRLPQSCVGTVEEDVTEMMPLQPYLLTPPSSPTINPKVSQTDWV